MNCKTFENMIPAYLKDQLSYADIEDFQHHLDGCQECKDELTIQFLVHNGLEALENGDAFDLDSSLENKLNASKRSVTLHYRYIDFRYKLFNVLMIGLGIFLIWNFG